MTSTGSEGLLTSLNNNNKWELTPYDKVRAPHEPVNDSSEITVSPK
uniref:Uncharacterized protein n=1 Tax=Romanomermis culicivorax TaxID=13658 RepID=A0A915ILU4_ROMCU